MSSLSPTHNDSPTYFEIYILLHSLLSYSFLLLSMPTTAELDQLIRAQAETIAALTARIQSLEDAQRPSSTSSLESTLSTLAAIHTDQQVILKDVLVQTNTITALLTSPLFPILPSQLFSSYTTIKPDIPLSISKTCISDKLSLFRLVPYDNHCAQPTILRPLPWPTFLTSFIEFSLRPLPWPNILISFLELCRLPLKSQFCLLSHASSL